MALIYNADIRPSKLELVQAWAPTQSWFPRDGDDALSNVGAYRFDDPAGEVGIETLLLSLANGTVIQIPLTYRGAPLEGAEKHLITTMEHSVLGDRWVYDGVGDPVYVAATANAALTGGSQAELLVSADGSDSVVRREPTVLVTGSGTEASAGTSPPAATVVVRNKGGVTLAEMGEIRLAIARVVSGSALAAFTDAETLAGTWAAQDAAVPLVAVWRG